MDFFFFKVTCLLSSFSVCNWREEMTQRFSPTILKSGVLHSVGAVSFVRDVTFCFGARGIDNVHLNVISSSFLESAGIDDEVRRDISEDPWIYESLFS